MEEKNDNKVNVYFVPNMKNPIGGQFYNLYVNRGEQLDLKPFLESVKGDVDKLIPQVREEDASFKGAGGMILRQGDEFQSASVYSPNEGGIKLTPEQQETYNRLLTLVELSSQQAEQLMETQKQIEELTGKLGLEQKGRGTK